MRTPGPAGSESVFSDYVQDDGLAFAPKLARTWYTLVTRAVRTHALDVTAIQDYHAELTARADG